MEYYLSAYNVITSKKDGKKYIIAYCVCDSRHMYNIFMNYTEMLEEFCKNNIKEDITDYIRYKFSNNVIVPYINI